MWRLHWLLGCALLTASTEAAVWHVDDDAPAGGDGLTWNTAFPFLQDALAEAAFGDEIRIAQGVYLPDRDSANPTGSLDVEASFELVPGVVVNGSYAGFGAPDPDARDYTLYETALSGDLLGDDGPNDNGETFANRADNSATIVLISWHMLEEGEATLDGVTIRQANGWDYGLEGTGGGLTSEWSNPVVSNCLFWENEAEHGGALTLRSGAPQVKQCRFEMNFAREAGAIRISDASAPVLIECAFLHNKTTGGAGGAIREMNSSTVRYEDCQFVGNIAYSHGVPTPHGDGGAVAATESQAEYLRCYFSQNHAGENGGALMYAQSATPQLTECVFEQNSADDRGGALYFEGGEAKVISNCEFIRNRCGSDLDEGWGGAIYTAGQHEIADCLLEENTADNGGAIYLKGGERETRRVLRTTFRANSAHRGGAVKLFLSDAAFRSCDFFDNQATYGGAAEFNPGIQGPEGKPIFVNCRFVHNHSLSRGGMGYAVGSEEEPSFVNCLIAGNSSDGDGGAFFSGSSFANFHASTIAQNTASGLGAAIYSVGGDLTISNSIVWGDVGDKSRDAGVIYVESGQPVVNYSCVEGWPAGDGLGNISDDPRLRDPRGLDGMLGTVDDDWRLAKDSPCLDAGDNALIPADTLDLDDDGDLLEMLPLDALLRPRVMDALQFGSPVIDMGMLETQPGEVVCEGDLDGDGDTDQSDLGILLASFELDSVGDLDGDGDTDQSDLGILLADYGCGVG